MAAKLFYLPFPVALTTRGVGAPSAKAYFYETGTTTPLATYTTDALSIEHPHPIVANGSGRFPEIYLDNAVTARCIITDRDGAELCDVDPYIPGTAPDAGSLQPYADAAEASATNSSASAASASTSASSASTSASSASASASAAAASATIADNAADAAAIAVSLPSAAIPAANRTALALLSTAAPGHLMEAGREGMFVFDSSDLSDMVSADTQQGIYVAPSSAPTGAAGAWVRQFTGTLYLPWFGAVADNATDCAPAFNGAFRLAEALAVAGSTNGTIYRGGPPIFVGTGRYYCGSTLEPLATLRIFGAGGLGWGAATQIRFPAGVTAVRAQAHNTSGASTVDITEHFAGDALVVEDIYFLGGYAGTEGEYHGFHAKRAVQIERCTFDNFQGDGLYSNSTFGGGAPAEGNTNVLRATNCTFTNCRSGVSTEGDDANAWSTLSCSFINNRRWGFQEDSFLGNHGGHHHFDGNARTAYNDGTASKPCSYVYNNGHVFFAIHGQEAGASTNSPPATATDNTWWGYWKDQGAAQPESGVPQWASGITVRSGGPVLMNGTSNGSSMLGVHIENNGVSQLDQSVLMTGNVADCFFVSSGAMARNRAGTIQGASGGLRFGGTVNVLGDLYAKSAANTIGPSIGATVTDGETFFATRSTSHTLRWYTYDVDGNPVTQIANMAFGTGFGGSLNIVSGAGFWRIQIGGSDRFKVDNSGAIISSGGLFVDANQVVGARSTGWAADTGTAKKTATATYTVGSALTVGAAYVQAEVTAIITRQALLEAALRDATQEIKALKDALITHGLIGS